MSIALLRADPHRWGVGQVHQLADDGAQTLCGKTPGNCPGVKVYGATDEITCRLCRRAIEAKERSERIHEEIAQREEARRYYQAEWWRRYNLYLNSNAVWQHKRYYVLKRAGGLCEGCGEQPATQVHHEHYPQQCFAGDPEWIAQEKLFHLRALCRRCHEDIHALEGGMRH